MKAYYHLFLVLFVFIFIIPLHSRQDNGKKNIAVIELDSRGGLSEAEIGTITDRLRSLLVQTNAFNVVDRGRMKNILEEQGFQMSGCTSTECAVEAGKILGVEEMVSGTLGRLGELYTIDIILIDVESSRIIRSLTRDHTGKVEGLIPVLKEISEELAGIRKEPVATAFGGIRIETDPEDVEIFIDGEKKGTTPFTVMNLPVGKHTLKLVKNGYTDYETEINIAREQIRNISTELLRSYALTVNSKPSGADVFVNGVKVGVTPFRGYYPEDKELNVEVRKTNYESWTDQVTADRHRTLTAEMEYTEAYADELARLAEAKKAAETLTVTGEEESSGTWLWVAGGVVVAGAAAYFILTPPPDENGNGETWPNSPARPTE